MPKTLGIDYFGKKLPFAQLHNQTTLKIRRDIYNFFTSAIGGVKDKVFLDHGSTPETTRQASNCFIRWLMENEAQVYATSPEKIDHLEQVFPGLVVLPWPPLASNLPGIDYLISSAVIEHVGTEKSQIEYLSSLFKLCPRVLVTTPNRYHWLEFHTKLPLFHWLPRSLHRTVLRLLGMKFWAEEQNLRLLSKQDFARSIESAAALNGMNIRTTWYQPRFLGLASNLYALVEECEAAIVRS